MEKELVKGSLLKEGISIIICCFNSAKRLPNLLSHLEKLDRNGLTLEIIVVDNLSTDSTFTIAEAFFNSSKIKGRVLKESIPGLSFARKKGVLAASCKLVLFCDDDNFFEQDYLQYGYKLFTKNPKMGCLGGLGIPKVDEPLPNWFETFGSSYAVGSLGKKDGIQPPGSIHYGAGLFFMTDALVRFYKRHIDSPITDRKGKSLSSGGDSELCLAIQLEGYEIWYDSNLHFLHKIDNERISKDYYIKLKKGIIANYPILSAYEFLLNKEQIDYNFYLKRKVPDLLLGSIKTGIKLLIYRDFKSKIYFYNYLFKLKGLLKNYAKSIDLFHILKSNYYS